MIVTIYSKATGEIKRVLALPARALERNIREGEGYVEGQYDRLSQRVDLATGKVVDASPNPTFERERRRQRALRSIRQTESTQDRAVRDALLAILPDGPQKDRLKKIDDEIAAQRADLSEDAAGG